MSLSKNSNTDLILVKDVLTRDLTRMLYEGDISDDMEAENIVRRLPADMLEGIREYGTDKLSGGLEYTVKRGCSQKLQKKLIAALNDAGIKAYADSDKVKVRYDQFLTCDPLLESHIRMELWTQQELAVQKPTPGIGDILIDKVCDPVRYVTSGIYRGTVWAGKFILCLTISFLYALAGKKFPERS